MLELVITLPGGMLHHSQAADVVEAMTIMAEFNSMCCTGRLWDGKDCIRTWVGNGSFIQWDQSRAH